MPIPQTSCLGSLAYATGINMSSVACLTLSLPLGFTHKQGDLGTMRVGWLLTLAWPPHFEPAVSADFTPAAPSAAILTRCNVTLAVLFLMPRHRALGAFPRYATPADGSH